MVSYTTTREGFLFLLSLFYNILFAHITVRSSLFKYCRVYFIFLLKCITDGSRLVFILLTSVITISWIQWNHECDGRTWVTSDKFMLWHAVMRHHYNNQLMALNVREPSPTNASFPLLSKPAAIDIYRAYIKFTTISSSIDGYQAPTSGCFGAGYT